MSRAALARPMPAPLVSAPEAAARIGRGEATLLDVREHFELRLARVEGALHVPMMEITARLAEVPRDWPVLVLCHSGFRSQQVADWLVGQGYDAANVAGGISAWADEVDASVGRY